MSPWLNLNKSVLSHPSREYILKENDRHWYTHDWLELSCQVSKKAAMNGFFPFFCKYVRNIFCGVPFLFLFVWTGNGICGILSKYLIC